MTHLEETDEDIAKVLKVSINIVKEARPQKEVCLWSKTEVAYLVANYKHKRAKELAKELNRSEKAIFKKAEALGLVKKEVKLSNLEGLKVRESDLPNSVLAEIFNVKIEEILKWR